MEAPNLDWLERGVEGAYRFLGRVWRYVEEHLDVLRSTGDPIPMNRLQDPVLRDFKRRIHTTIEAVTRDIDREKQFNTAIARLMELTNALYSFAAEGAEADALRREAVSVLLNCLSPFSEDDDGDDLDPHEPKLKLPKNAVSSLSGTTSSGSTSSRKPMPVHTGQAP